MPALPQLMLAWKHVTTLPELRAAIPAPVRPHVLFGSGTVAGSCGVCLHSVVSLSSASLSSSSPVPLAIVAGRNYHVPCANFWLNRVGPVLPALMP